MHGLTPPPAFLRHHLLLYGGLLSIGLKYLAIFSDILKQLLKFGYDQGVSFDSFF